MGSYARRPARQVGDQQVISLDSYRCTVCGYVYNPAVGDSAHGIKPKTAFDDLPADWKCPRCGVGKNRFVKI